MPEIITILGIQFSLCGIITFKEPAAGSGIGHYIAMIKSFNSWIAYDDLKDKPVPINGNQKMTIASALFVRLNNDTDQNTASS